MSFLASGYVAVMMPIGDISFFYSNIRSGVIVVEDKLYIWYSNYIWCASIF